MEIFLEQLVRRKKQPLDYVKIAFLTLAAAVLTLVLLTLTMRLAAYTIGLLVIAGVWYGYYLLLQYFSIEYEYALTENEMDVDKIIAKKRRKRVISVDFKEIEICARANDAEYRSLAEKTEGLSEIIDASGDRAEDNVYFVDFYSDSAKRRVFFRPTGKMIDAIYKVNPRCVHK